MPLLIKNFCILIKISVKFLLGSLIDNNPVVVQVMAWCQRGNKPLPSWPSCCMHYTSHKSHNASDKYPTMHHFVTEMCTHVHISVTEWCIVGLVHYGIYEVDKLTATMRLSSIFIFYDSLKKIKSCHGAKFVHTGGTGVCHNSCIPGFNMAHILPLFIVITFFSVRGIIWPLVSYSFVKTWCSVTLKCLKTFSVNTSMLNFIGLCGVCWLLGVWQKESLFIWNILYPNEW